MLARKKSFVSKNNILAAEITPEERARIASRALRKERSLHASAVGRSKKRVSNNKTKTSYSAATKKVSSSTTPFKKKEITTIYKAIDDIPESERSTSVNRGEEITVLDVLDHEQHRNTSRDDDEGTSTHSIHFTSLHFTWLIFHFTSLHFISFHFTLFHLSLFHLLRSQQW